MTADKIPQIYRTYKFRVLPSKAQHAALAYILEEQRILYNAALEERIGCFRKSGRSQSFIAQCAVLPYGFPQSTLLATLVVAESPLGVFLRAAARVVAVEVFLDDISLSDDDDEFLGEIFDELLRAVAQSGFKVNWKKASGPAEAVRLFNCELRTGHISVLEERQVEFYSEPRTRWSADRFERYCRAVEAGNRRVK